MQDKSAFSDYLKSLYKYQPLTREEERALYAKMQQGDWRAEEKLITHNLRFVVSIVKQMPMWQTSNIPFEDLIQAGNMGLIAAARKWTPQGNTKFVSYAKTFIKRFVQRSVENTQRLIRLPVNISEEIRKMQYTERVLSQKLGRTVKQEELAEELGKSVKRIDYLKSILLREPTSLDALIDRSNSRLEGEE